MAIRLRKSFKVAPGVRVNVSKTGISTSIGGSGLTANVSKNGTRLTASVPRSGISISKNYPHQSQGYAKKLLVIIAVTLFIGWILTSR